MNVKGNNGSIIERLFWFFFHCKWVLFLLLLNHFSVQQNIVRTEDIWTVVTSEVLSSYVSISVVLVPQNHFSVVPVLVPHTEIILVSISFSIPSSQ